MKIILFLFIVLYGGSGNIRILINYDTGLQILVDNEVDNKDNIL